MSWSLVKKETDGGSSQRLRCDTVWLLLVLNGKDDGSLVKQWNEPGAEDGTSGGSSGHARGPAVHPGGAGLSSRSGSHGAITHLDKLSFPAARWLCTVRQRPLPALPTLPGSLGAVPPLLKASSPGGGTGAGFSPSRPSRSTASPAAAATLAPDRRVPLEARARQPGEAPGPEGHRGWRWGREGRSHVGVGR